MPPFQGHKSLYGAQWPYDILLNYPNTPMYPGICILYNQNIYTYLGHTGIYVPPTSLYGQKQCIPIVI